MLDVFGALLLGAVCATDVTVLIGLSKIRPGAKLGAFGIAAAWIFLIFAIGAANGFATGATGPFPAPVIAFLVLIGACLAAFEAWPAFRSALLSVPLAALIGVNASRIVGVYFLILHDRGRLAAPFATSAGWGDIITGLAAIPIAFLAASSRKLPRGLLIAWNAFGALDLFTAIALGALSAPGTPFRVFTNAPGTLAMGTLPWVVVPTLLVPLYLMTHLSVAKRLQSVSTEQSQLEKNFAQAV